MTSPLLTVESILDPPSPVSFFDNFLSTNFFWSSSFDHAFLLPSSGRQVDWLTAKMREANFTVSSMHGDMPQKEIGLSFTTPPPPLFSLYLSFRFPP
jgi:hypothetical protein